MNVTITGGTGFVGKQLIKVLLASSHEVRILGRSPKTGFPAGVHSFLWDAAKFDPPPESLEAADAIVHLAGEPVAQRWSPKIRDRIRNSRVEGTRRLVNALAKMDRPPATLISASAVGYYGDRGDEELDETSEPGTGFLPEVCQQWEAEAGRATEFGIRVVMLRIGVVLGAGGGALNQMLPPFRMFVGGQMGPGTQWTAWIHLDDLAGLIRHALEKPEVSGVVNATAPNPVRSSQFTRVLARTIRRPALFTVPKKGLQFLFGDMSQIMLTSQRALPKAAQSTGYNFQYPELAQALKNLLG
jgi:uncharacterized protein